MSALDEGRLAEIEAAALGATPGPWQIHQHGIGTSVCNEVGDSIADVPEGRKFNFAHYGTAAEDAAHIAAASPDVVLALVAELREARGDLIRVRDMADDLCDCGSMAGRFGAHDPRCPTALLRDALRGPVAARGSQEEPVDPSGPNGVQIAAQSREPITTADLADAAGRAKRAAQERLEGGR